MFQNDDLPKILDASFLYGEKKYLRRLNNLKNLEQMPIEQDLTFEEVLASCTLKGQEKIEKLISDETLQRDFLIAANQKNPHLSKYFYLPLIKVFVEPQQPLSNRDIESLLMNFGQVLKIINKEQFVYVLMGGLVEAWTAVKILNNTPIEETHRLFVQICFEDSSMHHIFQFNHHDHEEDMFVLETNESDEIWLNRIGEEFKYISVFELEVDNYSEEFHIKERIMGVRACNIVRIFYLVEKAYAFGLEVEQKDYKKELDIKMIVNKKKSRENQIVIMSNLWSKFVLAQRYTNELFAQIKEEFKFYQDYQLHSLAESRVKRMDKLYEDIDITFHYDE